LAKLLVELFTITSKAQPSAILLGQI